MVASWIVTVTNGLPEELALLFDDELEEELLDELVELVDELELLEELELEGSLAPPQAARPAAMIPTTMHRNVFIGLTYFFGFCAEAFRDRAERQSRAIVLRM